LADSYRAHWTVVRKYTTHAPKHAAIFRVCCFDEVVYREIYSFSLCYVVIYSLDKITENGVKLCLHYTKCWIISVVLFECDMQRKPSSCTRRGWVFDQFSFTFMYADWTSTSN